MVMKMNKFVKTENVFSIDSIGYALDRVFPSDFVYDGESHPSVEFVYVQSGKLEVVEEENVYIMEAGELIVHGPMKFHRLKSTGNTSPHVYNLSAVISGIVPESLYGGVFRLDKGEQDAFLKIFQNAEQFEASSNPDCYLGQEIVSELGAFIVRISRRTSKSNKLSDEPCAAVYRNLVETMNREIYANLSLSDIARREHISVSYVKALFYRYAGISPKTYYISLRTNEAARLLSEDMPINEISEKMNFSSPNYFSLFFKKNMGVTPNDYKKSIYGRI